MGAGKCSPPTWQEALALARQLDPLAPIAGQLAYVRALEHLQEWQPPEDVALLLHLLPDLLRGQKIADAEVIIASLDLAMAEADG